MTGKRSLESSMLRKGIWISFFFSLCLGFLDFYLGMYYAILSWRTYLGFFVGYFVLNLLTFAVILLVNKIKKFKIENFFFVQLITIVFIFNFVLINVKLNGWFNFLNLRSISDNVLLVLLLVLFVVLVKRNAALKSAFQSIAFNCQVLFLTIAITSTINFYLLNLPEPPTNKAEVIIFTLVIGIIPIIATFIVFSLKRAFGKIMSEKISDITSFAFIILLVLMATPFLNTPDFSHFLTAAAKDSEGQDEKSIKPNVIWIVLDTARRDHFSCYGYEREITPNIDRFAQDGILFTNYISTAPWTLPSHSSLFTGLYTSEHGAHFARKGPLYLPMPQKVKTVAEILSENGWKTAAISANTMLSKKNNFDQGFQFFYSKENAFREFFWGMLTSQIFPDIWNKWGFLRINVYSLSSELNKVVFQWLEKNRDEPFFLFLNYMEPHHGGKYIPGEAGGRFGVDWGLWNDMYKSLDLEAIVHKKKKISEHAYQLNRDWLDTKMVYLDENIGHLFDFLKANNLYDNSYIFLLSDHGDLFGEHYSFGHTMELYNELIHVPLIIKYPEKFQKKGISDEFVQNVDLMPELLSCLNLPIPDEISGQPLEKTNHDIISELFRRSELTLNKQRYSRDLKAIFDNSESDLFKFIQSSNGKHELYDLKTDSLELHNIFSEKKKVAEELNNRLNEWRKSVKTVKRSESELKKLDKRTKDRLRALGYIR